MACPAVSADCSLPTLSPRTGVESSEWQEFTDSGARVVRETGQLRSTGLAAGLSCTDFDFSLGWSKSWGQRRYVGVTNRQTPVETISDIDMRTLTADVMYPLRSGWAVGLMAEQRTTHRNIRTTPEATGYPERFSSLTLSAGARYSRPVSDELILSAQGWLGRGNPGTVWLDLPNADPRDIPLGGSRIAQAGITLSKRNLSPSGKGWGWSTQLNYSLMTTDAGAPTALFRAGRVVGIAIQPETELRTIGLYASALYSF